MKIFQQILVGFTIAICSGCLGYGLSQAKLAEQVLVDTSEVKHLKEADDELKTRMTLMDNSLRQQLNEERTRTDARIFNLTGLVQDTIKAMGEQSKMATELIQLIKVQNQINSNRP